MIHPSPWLKATTKVLGAIPPTTLYHYTDQSGFLGILKTGYLWATAMQYLNDSREYSLGLQLLTREIAARAAANASVGTLLQSTVDASSWTFPGAFVASLSAKRDDLSQWRAYGGGSRGFALGFQSVALMKQLNDDAGVLVPVQYISPRAEAGSCALLVELCDELIDEAQLVSNDPVRLKSFRSRCDFNVQFACAVIKDVAFAGESEWRAVVFGGTPPRVILTARPGPSQLIPTCEVNVRNQQSTDRLSLSEVILGPTPHRETAPVSAKLAMTLHGEPSPPVYVSDVPFRDW